MSTEQFALGALVSRQPSAGVATQWMLGSPVTGDEGMRGGGAQQVSRKRSRPPGPTAAPHGAMLPADVGGARTSPVQQTTTSWGGTRESPPTVRHFAGALVQAANSDDSDEGDSLLPATLNVSNVAFNALA